MVVFVCKYGPRVMIITMSLHVPVVDSSSASRRWKVIEVVSIKDNPERGRELGETIQKLSK